jgi:hypothetical protein
VSEISPVWVREVAALRAVIGHEWCSTGEVTVDGDGFVNMATGGMLALHGDADDSLAAFPGLVSGTDAIRDGDDAISNWARPCFSIPHELRESEAGEMVEDFGA